MGRQRAIARQRSLVQRRHAEQVACIHIRSSVQQQLRGARVRGFDANV